MNTHRAAALLAASLFALGVGCAGADKDDDDDDDDGLSPSGDEDADGYTNGDEEAAGSDPLDAGDIPYEGGWVKSRCPDDLEPTGDQPGQVAANFTLEDQFGQAWSLHDFCGETVMLEFSGFT